MPPNVCILGNVLIDLIISGITRLPTWGRESAGVNHRFAVAGQAGGMARALAALGSEPTVLSVVGDDVNGRMIIDALRDSGIDVTGIAVDTNAPTALSVAFVRPDGERAFASDFGALRHLDEAFVTDRWALIAGADTLAVAGLLNLPGLALDATERILARAQGDGLRTVLDTGWDPDGWLPSTIDGVRRLLKHVDVFLPNDQEANVLTGENDPERAAATLCGDGARLVVIKCGPGGSIARQGGRVWSRPAHKVTVEDTVGAGDVFDAGFLHACSRGADVPGAMTWANATAAIYISRTRDRFPLRAEIELLADRAPT